MEVLFKKSQINKIVFYKKSEKSLIKLAKEQKEEFQLFYLKLKLIVIINKLDKLSKFIKTYKNLKGNRKRIIFSSKDFNFRCIWDNIKIIQISNVL